MMGFGIRQVNKSIESVKKCRILINQMGFRILNIPITFFLFQDVRIKWSYVICYFFMIKKRYIRFWT